MVIYIGGGGDEEASTEIATSLIVAHAGLGHRHFATRTRVRT